MIQQTYQNFGYLRFQVVLMLLFQDQEEKRLNLEGSTLEKNWSEGLMGVATFLK